MGTKEQLIKEIERLPDDLIQEVYDFVVFVLRRKELRNKNSKSWGDFALSIGSFDFWNDPEEVEYSVEDLKKRA